MSLKEWFLGAAFAVAVFGGSVAMWHNYERRSPPAHEVEFREVCRAAGGVTVFNRSKLECIK